MIRDQGTLHIEREHANERAAASMDADARFAPAGKTQREYLIDGAPRLLEVCEAALEHWPEPEHDEVTGEPLPVPMVIPHELALDLYSAVRWAKGYQP